MSPDHTSHYEKRFRGRLIISTYRINSSPFGRFTAWKVEGLQVLCCNPALITDPVNLQTFRLANLPTASPRRWQIEATDPHLLNGLSEVSYSRASELHPYDEPKLHPNPQIYHAGVPLAPGPLHCLGTMSHRGYTSAPCGAAETRVVRGGTRPAAGADPEHRGRAWPPALRVLGQRARAARMGRSDGRTRCPAARLLGPDMAGVRGASDSGAARR